MLCITNVYCILYIVGVCKCVCVLVREREYTLYMYIYRGF